MNNKLYISIVILLAVLALLLVIAWRIHEVSPPPTDPSAPSDNTASTPESTTKPTQSVPNTQPTEPPTQPTNPPTQPTNPPTQPTEPPTQPTEPPTQPTEPPTQPTNPPTQPGGDVTGIGLYTREELENMSTTVIPYGPGRTSGGKRAPYAESDQIKYGQYGANFIAPDNGNVYLTFDCGYEYTATDENGNKYRVTEKILDVLKEKNIKAVFFITMQYAKSEPDLVQRMIDEGHAVGNHSNTHPVMPEQTIDKMIYEVMSLHEYVLEHFHYEMHLFRPPTGAYSVQSLAVVQNLGYKNVHWSFAYADYEPETQPAYADALDLTTRSHHSGAIYLLHAISETNAAILGELIDFLQTEGYTLSLFD